MSQVPYVQDWTQVLKEIQFDQVVCHFHSASYWPNYKYFGNLWCMRTLWDGYYKDHGAHKPSGSGHICGRREKRKGNGMERDENATGKRILFRLSPATPCNVNKQNKKTCPLFCSGSLPRCYINAWLFFPFGATALWEPWTASLQQNISLWYTDLDLDGHVCFKNILYKVVIPHLLIALSLRFQPTEKVPKPWWF